MLAKEFRLLNTAEIRRVAKNGKKARFGRVLIDYLAEQKFRVAAIVGRKASGNSAVIRNRFRREIYGFFSKDLKKWSSTNLFVVVTVLPDGTDKDFDISKTLSLWQEKLLLD